MTDTDTSIWHSVFRWLKQYKKAIGIFVLIATFVFLGWYIAMHPEIIGRIFETHPLVLAGLLVLYLCFVATNIAIVYVTVQLCKKRLSVKNSSFLSVYSSIINFFGPLQSGPGVRAVYLKTKIGLKIRDYTLAMLFYYFLYAAISTSLMFITTFPILTALGVVTGTGLVIYGARRFGFWDRVKLLVGIYIITVVQVLITAVIYHVELQATGTNVTFLQSASYAGSANLALFVSLTPGAIGFREAFLLFTQSLHGVSTGAIVAAGILDRAFYVVFLMLLFLVSLLFHVRDRIVIRNIGNPQTQD